MCGGFASDPAIDTRRGLHRRRSDANQARLFISLKPRDERDASADQVIARLRPAFAHDPRATLYLQAAQDIRVGGRQASGQYQYTLQADDLASLNTWAPRLVARLRRKPLDCGRQHRPAEQRARCVRRDRPRYGRTAGCQRRRDRPGAL